jgi:hypothetical protein
MIALALLLQAAPALPAPIGRQALPARGCAAYLWSRGPTPELIGMAQADPALIRLSVDGKAADHPRSGQSGGDAGFGFARVNEYRVGGGSATLELTITARPDLSQGAMVTDATLTLRRPGAEEVVLPVGGLLGCAATKP